MDDDDRNIKLTKQKSVNRLLALQNKVLYSYFCAALVCCTCGIDVIIVSRAANSKTRDISCKEQPRRKKHPRI